jgi:hypothetical protein
MQAVGPGLLFLSCCWPAASSFLNKLMSKGIYEESTEGRSRLSGAFSEMQSLVDPAHRHILEERERKRAEHDDAGDDPEQSDSEG